MNARKRPALTAAELDAVRQSCIRAGVDASDDHVYTHALWRRRHQREHASIDRLRARVVWAHLVVGPLARAWRTLAIAGPRGALAALLAGLLSAAPARAGSPCDEVVIVRDGQPFSFEAYTYPGRMASRPACTAPRALIGRGVLSSLVWGAS